MEVKQLLRQVRKYDVMVQRKTDEVTSLRASVVYETPAMGGDYINATSNPHRKEDSILRLVVLEKSLGQTIIKLTEIKKLAMDVIDSLQNPLWVDMLYRRYFADETWEQIAEHMGKSKRWVLKLHGEALVELSEKFSSSLYFI